MSNVTSPGSRDPLTHAVIGCAMEVHRALGPGLLESVYETCLAREFELNSISFARQRDFSIRYKGAAVGTGFRKDFVVANELVVELKAVDRIAPVHEAQLLSYLRLSSIRKGLLINFNTAVLRDGVKRLVL